MHLLRSRSSHLGVTGPATMDTLVPKSNELLVFRGAFGKFRGLGPNKPLHHFTYITTKPHIRNSILDTNLKAKTHLCTPELVSCKSSGFLDKYAHLILEDTVCRGCLDFGILQRPDVHLQRLTIPHQGRDSGLRHGDTPLQRPW
jgi:hypothetical protein